MEVKYLLDANIVIRIRHKQPMEVLRRFSKMGPGEAGISVIAYGELIYGAMTSSQRQAARERLRAMSQVLCALPLPEKAAETYGVVRAPTRKHGRNDRQQRSLDCRPCPGFRPDTGHEP